MGWINPRVQTGLLLGSIATSWKPIDNDVFTTVRHFFTFADIPKGCNSSFIALIPKIPNANLVKDFRPISLIGSIYKITEKYPSNRLVMVLGDIVSEVQSAFIMRRQILDGPFILSEVLQWCKSKKKQSLIFKVDFEKGFDLVIWDFLDDVLRKFGFGNKWCEWIQKCLKSSRGSILINGSPTEEFQFFKGLKQGTKVGGIISRVESWKEVIDKVESHLSKWKMHALSIGGRLTLLKLVLGSILIFYMSIYRVPSSVLQKMESIRCNFFNGYEELLAGYSRLLKEILWLGAPTVFVCLDDMIASLGAFGASPLSGKTIGLLLKSLHGGTLIMRISTLTTNGVMDYIFRLQEQNKGGNVRIVPSIILLKQLTDDDPEKELLQFLQDDFDTIDLTLAIELIGELCSTCRSKTRLKSLTKDDAFAIHNLFREISFPNLSGLPAPCSSFRYAIDFQDRLDLGVGWVYFEACVHCVGGILTLISPDNGPLQDKWTDATLWSYLGYLVVYLKTFITFLMGLDDVFSFVRSIILTTDPFPDVKSAFTTLSRDESYSNSSSKNVKSRPSAFALMHGNNNSWTPDKNNTFNGNNTKFGRNSNLVYSVNNVSTSDNTKTNHGKSNTNTLTNDQYQRLMALLSSTGDASKGFASIADVLVVPEYHVILLSVHKLSKDINVVVSFNETMCKIQDSTQKFPMGTISERGGLYFLDEGKITDLSQTSSRPCEICHKAKQTREPFSISEHKTVSLGEVVHLDVWGPYKVTSRDGFRFFLTAVDDYTRAVWMFEPNLLHLKTFGCLCFSTVLNESDKFSARSDKCVIVGYAFDKKMELPEPKKLHNLYKSEGENIESFGHIFESPETAVGQSVRKTSRKTTMPSKYNDYVRSKGVKYGIDKVVNYLNLSIENFMFSTSLNKIKEPATYSEAAKDSRWVEAINLEMEALNRNETWIITDLPSNRKPIGSKWVLKVKYKSSGEVERFKDRHVGKGSNQREDLNEDVYMTLPESYSDIGDKRVCKLVKSLYGLKQAPKKWNEKLTSVLLADGFVQRCKPCSTPIEVNPDNKKVVSKYGDDETLTGITHYHKIVGKLIYLTMTRPNIFYVMHSLSQVMHNLMKSHLRLAFRVLRYLKREHGLGVSFKRNVNSDIRFFVDSD
ncbi:RNA-directed DNA polymerase, eukaryota, reverse transcriptase zinc-binding domain protein [Tanacetum coccineum]